MAYEGDPRKGSGGTQGTARTSQSPPWAGLVAAQPLSWVWRCLRVSVGFAGAGGFSCWYLTCEICQMVRAGHLEQRGRGWPMVRHLLLPLWSRSVSFWADLPSASRTWILLSLFLFPEMVLHSLMLCLQKWLLNLLLSAFRSVLGKDWLFKGKASLEWSEMPWPWPGG